MAKSKLDTIQNRLLELKTELRSGEDLDIEKAYNLVKQIEKLYKVAKKIFINAGIEKEKEHAKSLRKFLKPGVKFKEVAKAINKDHYPDLKDPKPVLAVEKTKPPYNAKGKTNFNIRNKPGTYIIYKGKKMVYVGFSRSNVYGALYRHFAHYNDKDKQYRVEFKDLTGITVRVIYTVNGSKAKQLEGALIIKHRPEFNENKYDGFITDEKEDLLLKEALKAFPQNYTEDNLPF